MEKKKKQAPKLAPDGMLLIACEDESVWHVRAGVQGSLWEINTRTVSNPLLISTYARTDGYLGIIMPRNRKFHEDQFRYMCLLTKTEYEVFCKRRKFKEENGDE